MPWLTYTDASDAPADFALDRERVAIGRNAENDLVLQDPSVSRTHAVVLRRDGRFVLVDQHSSLGVVINGTPVKEHTLEDGDQILLGRQALCFRDPALLPVLKEGAEDDHEVEAFAWVPDLRVLEKAVRGLAESPEARNPAIAPRVAEVEEQLKELKGDLARARHQHEILRTLLRVSGLVHSTAKLDDLLSLSVTLGVKVLAADRGFLIMRDAETGKLSIGASHKMRSEEHASGTISFGIANQVLDGGQGIRTDDAGSDPRFQKRCSVLEMGIRSVVCVPLRRRGASPLGVLYVDRLASGTPFAPEDLESLQGLANVAAIAMENAGLHQEGARRIRVEEELRQARELEGLKSDFLSMVSHDLRTPLTSIKSWAEILQDDWERIADDERIRYLEIVNRECDRLTHLIDDLLDLQRADSGRLPIRARPVAAEELLRGPVDAFAASARAREIELSMDCNPSLPPVQADPERIAQVLTNLVGNALKFTPAGGKIWLSARSSAGEDPDALRGRTVTIDLNAVQPASFVKFAVADTGEGIPEELQATIFEKFRQVEAAQGGRPRGAGLGLTICKEIVEGHGGHISLTSQLGRGTTFSFLLPVARDALDTVP